ncbi:MAG: hypothetical protein FJ125_12715, partial [Deltaproteobacteria bacterium]|nr:hypothetical protein [Deltaproteobacteria bacterium]
GGPCNPCANGGGCVVGADCASRVCTGNVCRAASCDDGTHNGSESDADCGGPTCGKCAVGKRCNVGSDCASGSCGQDRRCLAASCNDGVRNGSETDVDCGGGTCAACGDSATCNAGSDCASGVCRSGTCQPPACNDLVRNGSETDVDCGGGICGRCASSRACQNGQGARDCQSGVCTNAVCQVPSCADGVMNGSETGPDCGGGGCARCADGLGCRNGSGPVDCVSKVCAGGICQAPACGDGVKNGSETDVDCGGGCPAKCAVGLACAGGSDCVAGVCNGAVCQAPSCGDGVRNGAETDVDCGGGTCGGCANGRACRNEQGAVDCLSKVCRGALCQVPACNDQTKNGSETDVDCGGADPGCARCAVGRRCLVDGDCQYRCRDGVCVDKVRLKLASGVRYWEDDSYAVSCEKYRRPVQANYLYEGATGDGVYRIKPLEVTLDVWCDMSHDNGGWTLVLLNSPNIVPVRPSWAQVINDNNIVGDIKGGLDGAFDQFLGVKYWNLLGTTLRLEQGRASNALEHRATFTFSLSVANLYALSMSNPQILIGGIMPGMYDYHNGRPLTTHDADHDAYGANCSHLYDSTAWWYGACWSGSFWGGGRASYTNNPYWTSSGDDYHPWGAIWVR